jgi:ribonuclease P protein component
MVGRLLRRAEFLAVAGARRKWVAPGLILQARAHDAIQRADVPVRVGLTASRKVGGAVVRNRARRRLRAAITHLFSEHAAFGYDYVVIARPGTAERVYADLVEDLAVALRRLGAWR